MRGNVARLFMLLALAVAGTVAVPAVASAASGGLREVLFVGNNWDGTASIVDPKGLTSLGRIDIVPDLAERKAEINSDPVRLGYFLAIRQLIGEGHDQLVDDLFSSHDGRFVYVSRPSLADVVAIELATGKIVWRTPVAGQRADHMAISPDGRTLLVSASTANVVHAIDTATGKIIGGFDSGDSPHENNYSRDGSRVFHASIGLVYTPLDDSAMDATKGDRWFQIVDAKTWKILKRIDIGAKLREFGMQGMSGAVRPMAVSPDERYVYMQVSFFHGFIEYDLVEDRVTRIANLPVAPETQKLRRDEYLLDSAHHGLAINPKGTTLCAAGTMSNYVALVSRMTLGWKIAARGSKPYWVTNSGDGRGCFVSFSGDDQVALISYRSGKVLGRVPVGDHPQRMRMGVIDPAALAAIASRSR